MRCQCDRSDLSDKVMNAFWENLKIRNKKIQDIVDMIRKKKQSARDKIKPNKDFGRGFYLSADYHH